MNPLKRIENMAEYGFDGLDLEESANMHSDALELMKEINLYRQGHIPYWFWYRDVIIQAQLRDLIKIVGHSKEMPFWWRKFGECIEIVSEQLKIAIENGSLI